MQKKNTEASHTSQVRKPINWTKIKSEYCRGASITALSKKYNVAKSTISVRCNKEQWLASREKRTNRIEQKVERQIIAKKSEYEQAFLEALYELTTKTMEGIKSCAKKNSKSLKEYSSILKDLRDIGVYRSNLDLKEQKARIERLMKDTEKEERTTVYELEVADEHAQ